MRSKNHAWQVQVAMLLSAVLMLGACDDDMLCPGTRNWPAVTVNVTDSITGAPAVEGAIGVLRDGTYIDTLRASTWNSDWVPIAMSGAIDRPGRYTVEIYKVGYKDWRREGVEVEEGTCGVKGKLLEAGLQPN